MGSQLRAHFFYCFIDEFCLFVRIFVSFLYKSLTMRYLVNLNTNPYYNMAFDEYVLEQLVLDEPLFYIWQNSPAVIVGLNQDASAEVNSDYLSEQGIALVRRVTGGGAVYHDFGNLNYTIVGRSADLERDYAGYTSYILHALHELGVDAKLTGRNDILVQGCKVSGYAKRVYKDRLMVHGTLMYDVDLERLQLALTPSVSKLSVKGIASVRSRVVNLRSYLPALSGVDDLRKQLERILSRNYVDAEYVLSPSQLSDIALLAEHKFASPEWIYGRRLARRADAKNANQPLVVQHTSRLACGGIEIYLQIVEGTIVESRLTGDFIGNLSTSEIEERLVGMQYSREVLEKFFTEMGYQHYFDGVCMEDLLNLFSISGDGW